MDIRVVLVVFCAVLWVIAAIGPIDRVTWGLEQVATGLVMAAIWMQTGVRYSTASLAGLALLFCAHTVGTHYTYSLTPYDSWINALNGLRSMKHSAGSAITMTGSSTFCGVFV